MAKIDFDRPYGTCLGDHGRARYVQDGIFYDPQGNSITDAEAAPVVDSEPESVEVGAVKQKRAPRRKAAAE